MNLTVLLSVLAVLAVSVGLVHAEILSPYQQFKEGTPADQVVCADGKILMRSPSGSPACVFARSAETLIDRGFEQIVPVTEPASRPEAKSTEPRPIPAEIASANNAFAFDFYRQIADGEGNHFFSPASMHAAFSVLYEGVKGETAEQIRGVFGMAEDDAARHQAASDTMSSLNREDPHATLEMANSLWLAERLVPHARYVEIVRGTYTADIETVDFADSIVAADRINGWAAEKTHDKIPKVLEPEDLKNALAVILNAIYFKGTWVTQFDPDNTQPRDFDTGNGTVMAEMMHADATFGYAEYDGAQILRMPYVGDRLSMLAVLPPGRDGMAALEESLTAEMLEGWQQSAHDTYITVSIPKFETKTHYDLIPELMDLGITLIFGGGDLGGISDTYMVVAKATQDAYVNVNEEGTEAAAVTALVLDETAPPTFIADRPFLFFIQDDESGAILFMGKIVDPRA